MTKTFNCSLCSAPLDLAGAEGMTVRCGYCGNNAILPEELRPISVSRPSPGGSLLSLIDRAMKMAEISQLLQARNKIGAIKLYRETFGSGLAEAKAAVEQIERGQPITVTQTDTQSDFSQPYQTVQPAQVVNLQGKRIGRWVVGFIVLLILVPIIFAAVGIITAFKAVQHSTPTFAADGSKGSSAAPGFAAPALEFGSEGIGAGQFKDARSVAVDTGGRIYVGEYLGGRIQVFDSQGKFLTQWMLDPKAAVYDLEVDRKGVVYVAQPRATYRYSAATGELLGEVAKPPSNPHDTYYDVEVGLDGSLYAISGQYNLVHIGPDGAFRTEINLREKTSEDGSFERLAVDGQGNMYVMGRSDQTVYKLSPNGKFINRFGGRGNGPGQFSSANSIAVDGQGRIYVSDSGRGVHVFDNDGRYLDSFGGNIVIFGMAIDDRNEIFATERNRYKIVKYVPVK